MPLNTLLRAEDFAFMLADSYTSALVYSPEYQVEVERALEQMERPRPGAMCTWRRHVTGNTHGRCFTGPGGSRHPCGRRLFLALYLGSTGRPKGPYTGIGIWL